jgi:hypothetical protein
MNKYFIPYLVACESTIIPHIAVVEANDAIEAENKAIFEIMDENNEPIFVDPSDVDVDDYILVNMDCHIMVLL